MIELRIVGGGVCDLQDNGNCQAQLILIVHYVSAWNEELFKVGLDLKRHAATACVTCV